MPGPSKSLNFMDWIPALSPDQGLGSAGMTDTSVSIEIAAWHDPVVGKNGGIICLP
jgi:hypothetical protein